MTTSTQVTAMGSTSKNTSPDVTKASPVSLAAGVTTATLLDLLVTVTAVALLFLVYYGKCLSGSEGDRGNS